MYRKAAPMDVPDAFEDDSDDAQLTQSAFLLSSALVVGGYEDRVQVGEFLGFDADALSRKTRPTYDTAIRSKLDVDTDTIDHGARHDDLYRSKARQLAMQTRDEGEPEDAVALMAAGTQSDHQLVRVSAAAAATIATEPREALIDVLVEGVDSEDELVVDVAATALANIDPDHPALEPLVGDDPEAGPQRPLTNTVFMTHGTWARRGTWWRPGGDFYGYIDAHPDFDLHDESFRWSGSYLHFRRETAALGMTAWIDREGLQHPDLMAHSHGVTVANLATRDEFGGQDFRHLVMLSWPVHAEWFPIWDRVDHVFSFRVNYDLVIMADRGGQVLTPPPQHAGKVTERINGWFSHSDPHEEDYWEDHQLAALIP